MNIKHISITAAGNVTAVIPTDLPVTLGLHRPGDENYLLERVRRFGDAHIHRDSVIVRVNRPRPHAASYPQCLPLGQSSNKRDV